MNTSSPQNLPEDPHSANNIGTAVANTLLMLIIIWLSHGIFNAYVHDIQKLSRDDWQKVDILVTDDIQFRFLKFRTGETKFYIERDHQEFYSQSCNGRLAHMCEDLQNDRIKPTSLNFYTLIDPVSTAYTQLQLNSITFTDTQGHEQLYPNRQYAPNAPEIVWQAKKDMVWFFLPALIGYFIFGVLSASHNMGHLITHATVQRYATYSVIACFTLNYLYFVVSYLLILIT